MRNNQLMNQPGDAYTKGKDLRMALNTKLNVERSVTAILSGSNKYRSVNEVTKAIKDYLDYDYPTTAAIDEFCVSHDKRFSSIVVTIAVGTHHFPMTFLVNQDLFTSTATDFNYAQTIEDTDLTIEFEYDKPAFESDMNVEVDWPFPTYHHNSKQDEQKDLNDAYERAKKAVSDM